MARNPEQEARHFLEHEQAFRLGELLTESPHPKTMEFGETVRADTAAGVEMLLAVDQDVAPAAARVIGSAEFERLRRTMATTLREGGRIFLTGCGATGRLSILLEAAWRGFWQRLAGDRPALAGKLPAWEDRVVSVMAGGDFALIKSVEGFEDYPSFGRRQLRQAGVAAGDLVVAITEGGETPFVIGAAWEGLDAGAQVFFVYNNPSDLLRAKVERSRQVIDEPRIHKLDLTTGPMAVNGSTRMQATTSELLVVGAALELALAELLAPELSANERRELQVDLPEPEAYPQRFAEMLRALAAPAGVGALVRMVELEEAVYRRQGLVTYLARDCLLDVLTDTTERSPTFMLPPFRQRDDQLSPASWAFARDPCLDTPAAWARMLGHRPRGLDWDAAVYQELKAPLALQQQPPALDVDEIHKFPIGNEPDVSRSSAPDSLLVRVLAGKDEELPGDPAFARSALVGIGLSDSAIEADVAVYVPCPLASSPLELWRHLAVKLVFNTVSTATMGRLDRVWGNCMVWVSPSNKKLIDRGTRLVAQMTGLTYEAACIALHEAIAAVDQARRRGEEAPSPVAMAIKQHRAEGN